MKTFAVKPGLSVVLIVKGERLNATVEYRSGPHSIARDGLTWVVLDERGNYHRLPPQRLHYTSRAGVQTGSRGSWKASGCSSTR